MAVRGRAVWLWALWSSLTVSLLGFAAVTMAYGGIPRQVLLIGRTTDGHHQIELACNACHTTWFGGRNSIEKACLSCHAEDLTKSNDNHPSKKFRDPRNAERLARLDATKCLTCHVEHHPEVTQAMGVTLPMDFCVACHSEVGNERPSHKGLRFDSCASAGCHNFHDNQSLYEDFLEKHLGEAETRRVARISLIDWNAVGGNTPPPKTADQPDAPPSIAAPAHVMSGWLGTAHKQAGVNCSGCHQPAGAQPQSAATWIAEPGMAQCRTCHTNEANRFVQGKHGMRLAEGLWTSRRALFGLIPDRAFGPMRPEDARLPMKPTAHGRELQCKTCHKAHVFDVQEAKVDACAGCHNDPHTRAYFQSAHFRLWKAEVAGKAPNGSGVTCASCHMPRLLQRDENQIERVFVDHNQNNNLRPNEKMARTVCMNCHGLSFTLDSLADRRLIDRNFKGRSSVHVESIDWVERRVRQRGETP